MATTAANETLAADPDRIAQWQRACVVRLEEGPYVLFDSGTRHDDLEWDDLPEPVLEDGSYAVDTAVIGEGVQRRPVAQIPDGVNRQLNASLVSAAGQLGELIRRITQMSTAGGFIVVGLDHGGPATPKRPIGEELDSRQPEAIRVELRLIESAPALVPRAIEVPKDPNRQ